MTRQTCDFCKKDTPILFKFHATEATARDDRYQMADRSVFRNAELEICLDCINSIPRKM